MDTLEVTGKTIDDAIAAASAKLNIPADRLDYTIVSEGSKGILGIGAEEARIIVSLEPALAPGESKPEGVYRPPEPAAAAPSTEGAAPAAAPAATHPKRERPAGPKVENAGDL